MNRGNVVSVRLSDSERAALQALAAKERRPLSEMLRETIRNTAKAAGCWPANQQREVGGYERT